MENSRTFLIILDNKYKMMVVATTKWHALDIAWYKYPQFTTYQYCNIIRNRNKHGQLVGKILDKL